jgi:hypothetical protein
MAQLFEHLFAWLLVAKKYNQSTRTRTAGEVVTHALTSGATTATNTMGKLASTTATNTMGKLASCVRIMS